MQIGNDMPPRSFTQRLKKIFVINAATQLGRWTHMVCGDVMSAAVLHGIPIERFDAWSSANSNCTPPYSMEDCCTVSHLAVMRTWAQQAWDHKDWAVVLEDDVVVNSAIRPALALGPVLQDVLASAESAGRSFVYLGACSPECLSANATDRPRLLKTSATSAPLTLRSDCGSHCTHAYVRRRLSILDPMQMVLFSAGSGLECLTVAQTFHVLPRRH